MKKNIDLGKHQKNTMVGRKEIEEEQILIGELKKEMEKEILNEGLFILAIYVLFMDVDL